MIITYLANGFEEIEALATVDILRRCEFDVKTVGVGGNTIIGAHNITVIADDVDDAVKADDNIEAVILPGGMPGTLNEEKSEFVQGMIDYCNKNNILICAICAAPSILGNKGLLKGKKATCFPGFEDKLIGAKVQDDLVVRDGNFITAKGAGASFEFAFEIAKALCKEDTARKIKESMQCTE